MNVVISSSISIATPLNHACGVATCGVEGGETLDILAEALPRGDGREHFDKTMVKIHSNLGNLNQLSM
jgi:hypothetical protein